MDFEARFCGFLQHHGLWLLVLIIGSLWFAAVFHSFLVALSHTLHAALERYIDIAALVFNYFGHSFAVFGAF